MFMGVPKSLRRLSADFHIHGGQSQGVHRPAGGGQECTGVRGPSRTPAPPPKHPSTGPTDHTLASYPLFIFGWFLPRESSQASVSACGEPALIECGV